MIKDLNKYNQFYNIRIEDMWLVALQPPSRYTVFSSPETSFLFFIPLECKRYRDCHKVEFIFWCQPIFSCNLRFTLWLTTLISSDQIRVFFLDISVLWNLQIVYTYLKSFINLNSFPQALSVLLKDQIKQILRTNLIRDSSPTITDLQ